MSRDPITPMPMERPGPALLFNPPLLNSASLWATTYDDLLKLYKCPSTGAITTRTCLLTGFKHEPSIHQHCFVDTQDPGKTLNRPPSNSEEQEAKGHTPTVEAITSLNTLGYSPLRLSKYLKAAVYIHSKCPNTMRKPFIFSVTGSPHDILACFQAIASMRREHQYKEYQSKDLPPFHLEINLSCPNITNKPPPAYSRSSLAEYLSRAAEAKRLEPNLHSYAQSWGREYPMRYTRYAASPIYIGLKLPPYTYATQFSDLIAALRESAAIQPLLQCPIHFITTTNTLGSSLLLTATTTDDGKHPTHHPAIASASGMGTGGLAGAALHPLALGNVATLRRMLDEHAELRHIEIIGVGGVSDRAGYERMKSAGAAAVGVATALGVEGVDVFEQILKGRGAVKDKDEVNLDGLLVKHVIVKKAIVEKVTVDDETREYINQEAEKHIDQEGREDISQEGREDIRQEGRENIRQEGREDIRQEGEGEGSRLWRDLSRLREIADKAREDRKRKSDQME